MQLEDPLYEEGANEMSLVVARKNFRKFGAISENYVDVVRRPHDNELP